MRRAATLLIAAALVVGCPSAPPPGQPEEAVATPTPSPAAANGATPAPGSESSAATSDDVLDVLAAGGRIFVNQGGERLYVSSDAGGTWKKVDKPPEDKRRDFGSDGTDIFVVQIDRQKTRLDRLSGTSWVRETGLPDAYLHFADGDGTMVALDESGRAYRRQGGTWAEVKHGGGRPLSVRTPWLAQVASGTVWVLGSTEAALTEGASESVVYRLELEPRPGVWMKRRCPEPCPEFPVLENVPNTLLFAFATDGRRLFVDTLAALRTYSLDLQATGAAAGWQSVAAAHNGTKAAAGSLYRANSRKLQRLVGGEWKDWGDDIKCTSVSRLSTTTVVEMDGALFWGNCSGLVKGDASRPDTKWQPIRIGG